MPETKKTTKTPLEDAIKFVTKNGLWRWQFIGWTDIGEHKQSFDQIDRVQPLTTGIRGATTDHQGVQRNFTIRLDYDYADGELKDGGKGYHVNVETKNAKIAYVYDSRTDGLTHALDRQKMLSERRLHDGDEEAARWFMDLNKGT